MCAAFLPPCAPHFDGRAAVRPPPFVVKMWHVRRIVERLAKIAVGSAKAPQFRIPAFPAQIQRQTIKVRRDFLSKKRCTNFTNCCFLFDAYRISPLYMVAKVHTHHTRPNYNGRSSDKSPDISAHFPSTCLSDPTKWPDENALVALAIVKRDPKKSQANAK